MHCILCGALFFERQISRNSWESTACLGVTDSLLFWRWRTTCTNKFQIPLASTKLQKRLSSTTNSHPDYIARLHTEFARILLPRRKTTNEQYAIPSHKSSTMFCSPLRSPKQITKFFRHPRRNNIIAMHRKPSDTNFLYLVRVGGFPVHRSSRRVSGSPGNLDENCTTSPPSPRRSIASRRWLDPDSSPPSVIVQFIQIVWQIIDCCREDGLIHLHILQSYWSASPRRSRRP